MSFFCCPPYFFSSSTVSNRYDSWLRVRVFVSQDISQNLHVCSGRREERNWFNRFKVLVLNSYLGKQQIIHKKKRPFMCLSHEKTASLCAYIYSTTGNTRLSKIKMCSKHHLGLQMHEPSNMAAVSLCQFWTIELQLAAWRESVKRPRTSLLTWWMVCSLYVWSFVAIVVLVWVFVSFVCLLFTVCHTVIVVAFLDVSLLLLP